MEKVEKVKRVKSVENWLTIDTSSNITAHRLPKSFQTIEEDTYEVEASSKFEEFDNQPSSTSAPLS